MIAKGKRKQTKHMEDKNLCRSTMEIVSTIDTEMNIQYYFLEKYNLD